jgi:hypothetical protein
MADKGRNTADNSGSSAVQLRAHTRSSRPRVYPKPPKNHAYRVGRVQRQIRRAFIANNGQPLTTNVLMRWAYPQLRKPFHWCYRQLWEAAERYATRIGRSKTGSGRPWLWVPK